MDKTQREKLKLLLRSFLVGFQIKNTSIYTLSTFLIQFGAFLIVPLFWRKLSPTDYGIIAVIEILGTFLSPYLGLCLEQSITRFYYEWPQEKRRQIIGTIWAVNWLSITCLGSIALYIVSLLSCWLFPNVSFFPYIFLGFFGSILSSFRDIAFVTIRIKQLPWLYFFYSITNFVINTSSNIYFILLLNQGVQGYFLSNIISMAISNVICIFIMLHFATPCLYLKELKEPFKYSWPLVPSSIIFSFNNVIDRFALQYFVPLSALGLYSLSLKFTSLISQLQAALKQSYTPFMVKEITEDKDKGVQNISKISIFYLLPIITMAMGISFFIKEFVYIINRPEYYPIVGYVQILVIPAVIATFYLYFTPGIFLSKKTKLLFIPALVQLVFTLGGSLILVPIYKLPGLIVNKYLSIISYVITTYIITNRCFPFPVKWSKIFLQVLLLIIGILISNFISMSFIFNIITKGIIFFSLLLVSLIIAIGYKDVFRYIFPKRGSR